MTIATDDCAIHLAVKNFPADEPRAVQWGMRYFQTKCGLEVSYGSGHDASYCKPVPHQHTIVTQEPVSVNADGSCNGCFPEGLPP